MRTYERAEVPIELMDNLPAVRVNRTARAFIHTGVDYAGPIAVWTVPGRGHKSHKAYIVLFVCLTSSWAIILLPPLLPRINTLYPVGDYLSPCILTTESRFTPIENCPMCMRWQSEFLQSIGCQRNGMAFLSLLRRRTSAVSGRPIWKALSVIWNDASVSTLIFEKMSTLLCRIEACLNSQPIAPVSDNLDDYHTLTSDHFLIRTSLIRSGLFNLNEHRLSRWQMIQRLKIFGRLRIICLACSNA